MTGTRPAVKELEAQLQEASARVEALEAEVKQWCDVVENEQQAHERTKAAAFDYQQRAERAEGHLRLLASYGGTIWEGDHTQWVEQWKPASEGSDGLELAIACLLEEQQDEHDTDA